MKTLLMHIETAIDKVMIIDVFHAIFCLYTSIISVLFFLKRARKYYYFY